MRLFSDSFDDGSPISGEFALCVPDPDAHVRWGGNRSPHLAWEDLPADTRSIAVICVDPDVPSSGENVNQEGKQVPADLPRVDFYHWVLVDLPPATSALGAGAYSDGVTEGGKDASPGPAGGRPGLNDYTGWFAPDPDMAGDYFGYDGPCPPWNDSIVHRYVFTAYALDLDRCPVEGAFTGPAVIEAIEGHVLAQASITGTYTLNPDLG